MKYWTYLLLLITFLAGTGAAPAQNTNTNITTVTPTAVIPFLAQPPAIDGTIDPQQWKTLHVARLVSQNGDLLETRPGEFWLGCDRKNLYVAVRSGVHPTLGPLETHAPGGNSTEVVFDDAIEIWVDNNPGGDSGHYYQIMVNPRGASYNAAYDHRDKVAQNAWRAQMRQAHRVKNGIWDAEFAIDLASLGVTDPTHPLGVHVCRDYKNPWDQARWEPLVTGFDAPEKMARVRFADGVPIVSEQGVQDAQGIDLGLTLTNPTAGPLTAHVALGYNAQDQPRYYQQQDVTLAPGQTQTVEDKKPFFSTSNYAALGEMLVTDAAGGTLYHRDFKWQTRPTGPLWDVAGTGGNANATKFEIGYYPSYRMLRWQADLGQAAAKDKVQRLRLAVCAPSSGRVVARDNVGVSPAEHTVPLPLLPPGTYEARLYADGAMPSTKPLRSLPFLVKNDFPWQNNRLGMADMVIPPFTPLTVQHNVVGAVLRRQTLGGNGFPSQLNALGRNLLVAPMQLTARQHGKTLPLAGKLVFDQKKPTTVRWHSDWASGPLAGRTTGEMDFDGCIKVTLDLTPHGKTPVEALDLTVPLRDAEAPLMHACGDGIRFNYGGAIPPGEGIVWTSAQASRNDLQGTFLPYLWIGGAERGLVWFAANDRGWGVDPAAHVPALALERRQGALILHVHLIQAPTILDRPRRIIFGLQATPTKPMAAHPSWRDYGLDASGPFQISVLGMSMYWGADLYSVFPRGHRYDLIAKIADSEKHGARDAAFFDRYIAANPDFRAEVGNASQPNHVNAIIPYTNIRGEVQNSPEWLAYQDEWKRSDLGARDANPVKGSVDGVMIPVRSRQDYLLYNYRELLRHGFDGIYWDNMFITANANQVTGGGYARPDGTFQPDTDIWLLRQLAKRTAVMLYQMGRPNLTMPHMTDAYLIPVMSWSTINLDWEMHYGGSDFQDRFSRDYIQSVSSGRQAGNVPVVLQGITDVHDPTRQAWVERTRLGVCLPYELTIYHGDSLYNRVRDALYALGYGTNTCRVRHFWDDRPVVTVGGLDATWIAFEGKDKVLLLVTDYGGGGAARLTLDTARLGLPADFTASNWEKPDETWTASQGTVTIPGIAKHDFRLLVIPKLEQAAVRTR